VSEHDQSEVAGVRSPANAEDLAQYCRVDWARMDRPVRIVALCDRPYGAYLHWKGNGNKLCLKSIDAEAHCPLCADATYRKVWYAMILGHCLRTADTVLLLLPEHSYHRAKRQLSGSLAGRIITASRTHPYSTVGIEVGRAGPALSTPLATNEQLASIIARVYARIAARHEPKGETA